MLIVTAETYNKLKPATKNDLLTTVFGSMRHPDSLVSSPEDDAFDWEDRVDLSPGEVEQFFESGLHDNTTLGLRAIAEHGPVVRSDLLIDSGCVDLAAFQRSTTRRVRTITKNPHAFLLSWDEWENREGHYAVSPATHRSLRIYFELQ